MRFVNVEFEYEIEDVVYFEAALHSRRAIPSRFIVQERIAQECCAGVQVFYKLVNHPNLVPEFALTREMPAYEPVSEEEIADESNAKERRWQHNESMLRAFAAKHEPKAKKPMTGD
jgi:hypothetical protein